MHSTCPDCERERGLSGGDCASYGDCGDCGDIQFPWECGQSCYSPLWVRTEFLSWWTQGMRLPPLVTSSTVGTPENIAGALGQPNTTLLFGDQEVIDGNHAGGRISFGLWLSPCYWDGIEANYMGLGRAATGFRATSNETPIIARPFFDTSNNQQAAMLVAYPGLLQGSLAAEAWSELQSAEVLWRHGLMAGCGSSVHMLVGYRFGRLDENLRITQSSQWTAQQGQIIPGTTLDLFDEFGATSQFHGGEIGAVCRTQSGRWSLEVMLKIALGNTHSVVRIDGATQTTVPDAGSATFAGGLLAQETNIGRYERNAFSVLPELGATVGYDLTHRVRATVGYSLLCWTNVARPADQMDFEVSQFPPEAPAGSRSPALNFVKSDFWAQGLRLGVACCF
jgi:hypothetical protein